MGRDVDLRLVDSLCAGESGSGDLTGTKALLLAVLEDGIRSYLSPIEELQREAEDWVTSRHRRSPFAFVVICETLGLEPTAVRRAIRGMRDSHVDPQRAFGRNRPNVRRAHRLSTQLS